MRAVQKSALCHRICTCVYHLEIIAKSYPHIALKSRLTSSYIFGCTECHAMLGGREDGGGLRFVCCAHQSHDQQHCTASYVALCLCRVLFSMYHSLAHPNTQFEFLNILFWSTTEYMIYIIRCIEPNTATTSFV